MKLKTKERGSRSISPRLIGSLPDHKQDMLAITTAAATCFNSASPIFGQSSAVQRRNVAPVLSEVDLSRKFKRAEFGSTRATALEIVNVLGAGTLWMSGRRARTLSRRVRSTTVRRPSCKRKPANATTWPSGWVLWSESLHYQNVPSMPFKNEAMAASIGKTVEEMNALPGLRNTLAMWSTMRWRRASQA